MMKINKKGFTLVELLAVIAILAILMLLVTPNVLKLFNEGREDAFVTQCESIWKLAEQEYMTNTFDPEKKFGPYCSENEDSKLNTKGGSDSLKYYISFDDEGNVNKLLVTDGIYYYNGTSVTSLNNIKATKVPDGKTPTITCTNGTMTGITD